MNKATFLKSFAFVSCLLGTLGASAQFSFSNANTATGLTDAHSGCAVAVVDVNNDGLDDIVKMDLSTSLRVELMGQDGTFTYYDLGNISGSSRVWGMACADVDHNGWKDVVTGVNGTLYLVKLSWVGGTITKTQTTLSGSYFVQNITFGDFDNDGWVDLFVCDDNNYSKIYKNNAGTLTLTSTIMDTAPGAPLTYGGDPADSGNYGSVWTDFDGDGDLDLFVAHCRQASTSSTDLRRKDRLFVNNGSNVYTEQAAAHGIEVSDYKQTWTASFGDIDNDGDMDLVTTNHGETGEVLENVGGNYTVIAGSGFNTVIDPIESVVADFDNDTYLDIMISGSNNYFWHNNGDKTFTQVPSVLPNLGGLLSFATGDLNHDGFIDLYASYGNIYNSPSTTDEDVLYLNNKNTNHYITFNLTGTTSNHDAIGAKVIITGAFGTQVREVRAGETYGTANSMQCHFGLGSNTSITSATIEWPAGGTTTLGALTADQFVTVTEGGCTIVGNTIPGPYTLCTGMSTTLTAASGFSSYLWSNGATTQSVTTSATGSFNVLVSNGTCSNISPTVTVTLNPDETPSVTAAGSNYCQGVATLTSTPASSYSWTGPGGFTANTQSINPSQSGSYVVTITGTCANFSSTPYNVNILSAPAPAGTGASGPGPASFNLSASGTGGALEWYDMPTGGTLLGTGTTYTTPVISSSTTYYVQDAFNYPGATGSTLPDYHTGTNLYSGTGTNGSVDFDVLAACTLKTVKVYTDTPGNREIILQNSSGTTIANLMYNFIADTNIVTLNFALAPGTNYHLTTNAAQNNILLGTNSPRLMRSNTGVSYPYTLSGFVSLTGSNQGSGVYYYYYDWQLEKADDICISERTPVLADVTTLTGISAINAGNSVQVYPNPATTEINVSFGTEINGDAVIEVADVTGRIVSTLNVSNVIGGKTVQLGTEELSAGTYMVTIRTNTTKLIQKVMLTK
jgi:hypothetical protein